MSQGKTRGQRGRSDEAISFIGLLLEAAQRVVSDPQLSHSVARYGLTGDLVARSRDEAAEWGRLARLYLETAEQFERWAAEQMDRND